MIQHCDVKKKSSKSLNKALQTWYVPPLVDCQMLSPHPLLPLLHHLHLHIPQSRQGQDLGRARVSTCPCSEDTWAEGEGPCSAAETRAWDVISSS